MPIIRYLCRRDDPITGGGRVLEGIGIEKFNHRGMDPTAEGMKGWCNVCKSVGVIRCVEPRPADYAPNNIYGYKLALNGDHLICKCPKPQKLMHTTDGYQLIISDEYVAKLNKAAPAISASVGRTFGFANAGLIFNDKYVIKDQDGIPLANTEYALSVDGGEPEYGVTDASGQTHLLDSVAEKHHINIYLEG